jgi:putative transcriptional regulator
MAKAKLSNNVRDARAEKGYTQAVLAEKIGVSRQSINYIENGSIAPSITLALLLAKALDRELSELFYIQSDHHEQ